MRNPLGAHSSEVSARTLNKLRAESDSFGLDIDNQGSDQQELYWYMNSGHEQTESYRTGFFGPFVPPLQ